jgi:hypothetical protein
VHGNDLKNGNNNNQSFQDNAFKEGATPQAPSSDQHNHGFHPEGSPGGGKRWKNDAFKKVNGA